MASLKQFFYLILVNKAKEIHSTSWHWTHLGMVCLNHNQSQKLILIMLTSFIVNKLLYLF